MTVNIFGVGRSGTTVVQLYIAFLLASKYGHVNINMEPFGWLNRKGGVNYYGQDIYIKSGFFESNTENIALDKYLNSICKYSTTINKFIKGNGFLQRINRITKPDFTILMVRDLYDVLSSLEAQATWDFFTYNKRNFVSSKKYSYWSLYYEKIRKTEIIKSIPFKLSEKSSPRIKNAIHWYFMNYTALNSIQDKTYVVKYDEITKVEKLASKLLNIQESKYPQLKTSFFKDDRIHTEDILNSNKFYNQILKFPNFINNLLFHLNMENNLNIPFLQLPVGLESKVSNNASKINAKNIFNGSKKKNKIFKEPELEYLNTKINSLIEKVIKYETVNF